VTLCPYHHARAQEGQVSKQAAVLSAANAVAQADDAFGGSVGQETVGIYSDTDVRGFNPQRAGNSRMDGVYFDQLTIVPTRLREGSDIRVGFTALDYPAPAPTGIVAHRLRPVEAKETLNFGVHFTAYGGFTQDNYLQTPVVSGHFGIGTGFSYAKSGNPDGAVQNTLNLGLIAPVRFGGFEIKPLFSGSFLYDGDTREIVTVNGPFVPSVPKAGNKLAQSWARQKTNNYNVGVLVRAPFTGCLGFRGGFVQQRMDRIENYTEIYSVYAADNSANDLIAIDPRQNSYTNSWDALLYYRIEDKPIRHTLMLQYRGRRRHVESGGSDVVDFCKPDPCDGLKLGQRDPHPKPEVHFGRVSVATLRQDNFTLGYIGRWQDVGQLNLGVSKALYHSTGPPASPALRPSLGCTAPMCWCGRPVGWRSTRAMSPGWRIAAPRRRAPPTATSSCPPRRPARSMPACASSSAICISSPACSRSPSPISASTPPASTVASAMCGIAASNSRRAVS
jgi:iron complex outermembrane receptor protein